MNKSILKRIFWRFSRCLMVVTVWGIAALADRSVSAGNPYAEIVTRNVFELNPPASPTPVTPADPLPKITPNGIISIFGKPQVLFKVAGSDPGHPAREKSYILSEGQHEGDIEVARIDEKNTIIVFNNHGITQELTLASGIASSGSMIESGIVGVGKVGPELGRPDFARSTVMPNSDGLPGNRFGRNAMLAMRGRPLANNSDPSEMGADSGGSSDNDTFSHQGPAISAQEHLASEQMVIFAEQHMR